MSNSNFDVWKMANDYLKKGSKDESEVMEEDTPDNNLPGSTERTCRPVSILPSWIQNYMNKSEEQQNTSESEEDNVEVAQASQKADMKVLRATVVIGSGAYAVANQMTRVASDRLIKQKPVRPSWNITFETIVALLRTSGLSFPEDIEIIRLFSDNEIPLWSPVLPPDILLRPSTTPPGEWFYPHNSAPLEVTMTSTDNILSIHDSLYILFFHGGAFCCCSSATHRGLIMEMCKITGTRP